MEAHLNRRWAVVALVVVLALSLNVASSEAKGWSYPVLLTAPWTPFYQNLSINLDVIDAQIKMSKENGVTHAWISGGMAQFDQLTIEERMELAVVYLKALKKYDIYSILHVGHQTIPYAMQLAAFGESLGYDAIAVEPPFAPEGPANIQELVEILALIAGQAPNTPFYYYHIPGTTGLYYNMSQLLTLASGGVIPTMSGIKYVDYNPEDFAACVQMKCSYEKGCPDGKYNMMWAPNPKINGMQYGARGFVLTENYWAPYCKKVYDAYQKNVTLAQEYQNIYNSVGACEQDGKSIMRAMGVDLGPPRLPSYPVSSATYITQCQCLSEQGFFDAMDLTPNCLPPPYLK